MLVRRSRYRFEAEHLQAGHTRPGILQMRLREQGQPTSRGECRGPANKRRTR